MPFLQIFLFIPKDYSSNMRVYKSFVSPVTAPEVFIRKGHFSQWFYSKQSFLSKYYNFIDFCVGEMTFQKKKLSKEMTVWITIIQRNKMYEYQPAPQNPSMILNKKHKQNNTSQHKCYTTLQYPPTYKSSFQSVVL